MMDANALALAGGLLLCTVWLMGALPRLSARQAGSGSILLAVAIAAIGKFSGASTTAWLLPVVVLLGAHAGFVVAAWLEARRTITAPSTLAPSERRTVGRYAVEQMLGQGAMGALYLARDPKDGRTLAIKTMALGREFSGEALQEARRRFFREAETSARLQHPDIVRIFEAGEDRSLAYLAMEYVPGADLERHTQPGSLLPAARVVRIGARVAGALGHAHSQGVVPRDVKPAHVLVDLESDTVKVIDFGIAQITDTSRTRTGLVLGTPSFMSPEQMSGQRIDGRSDLYSLGVMLFQLLTGRLPHRAAAMAELMREIAQVPAPALSSLRPDLPPDLSEIVASLLEKDPARRPPDGYRLAAALRAVRIDAADSAQADDRRDASP